MAYPQLIVEMAFDASPYDVSPTWTDITQYVAEVSIHRGREDDWNDSFVSTATLTLINDDRRFDPFNVTGVYFGRLKPRRQVRVRGTIGGNTYDIFRGFVNGFPVSWTNLGTQNAMQTLKVDAFDLLALLSSSALKGDLAEIYTKSLAPRHYYRCSEPSGTTVMSDLGSGSYGLTHASSAGKKPVAYINLGLGLSGTSVNVSDGSFSSGTASVTSTTGDVTVSMWTAGTGKASRNLFDIAGSGSAYVRGWVGGSMGSGGTYIQLAYSNGASSNFRQSKTNGFDSSVPHHLLFTYKKSTGQAKIYVDGVDQTDTSGGDLSGINVFPNITVSFADGAYQDVSIFDRVLTATEITNLYQFGQGNQTEATNTRLSRLLALTDVSSSMYSVYGTAYGEIAGVPEPNQPVIEALLQAQKTEGGYLYVDRAGILQATNRFYFQGLTSQATFDDDGTDFGYSGDIDMWYDGDNLRNEVVVNYGGNASSQVSGLFDVSSIVDNGRHTLTIDSQSSTATEADELARFWLRYGIQNPPSISPFEVGLSASTAQWQTLLQLDVLDRITFKRTPAVGSAFQRDLLINNMEFTLTPKRWSLRLAGSSRFTVSIYERTATGSGTGSSSTSFVITDAPEIRNVTAPAYNHNSATFSCEVNALGTATNVRLQYSTDSLFGTFTEVTPTPSSVSGSSWTAVSVNVTGLSSGTTYYFRFKAYNAIATVYGSGGGITTYRLKTVTHTSSGTWTAPTWGGSVMTTAINVQLVAGGGGSGGYGGGGGGGGAQASASSITLSSSMTATVGAAGGTYGAGGNSSLTNFGSSCNGGSAGLPGDISSDPHGGASGGGNPGGTGYYAAFTGDSVGGGGGGATSAGSNHNYPDGGAGGNSGTTTYYSLSYGGGGGGSTNVYPYFNGAGGGGTYGAGAGHGGQSSSAGIIIWQYYAPGGSRSGTGWTEVNA